MISRFIILTLLSLSNLQLDYDKFIVLQDTHHSNRNILKSIFEKYSMVESNNESVYFLTSFFSIKDTSMRVYKSEQNDLFIEAVSLDYSDSCALESDLMQFKNKIKDCINGNNLGVRNCLFIEDGVIICGTNEKIFIMLLYTYKNKLTNKVFYKIANKIKRSNLAHLYWIDGYSFGEK